MLKLALISFRRQPLSARFEMCGNTTLFAVDLPVLFGGHAERLPRPCRAGISTDDEPSASMYLAPVSLGAEPITKDCPPVLLACALLFRYPAMRKEVKLELIPRDVDYCFKDTCDFPVVHVSLVGQDSGGYDFKCVIHTQLNVAEEFAAGLSAGELGLVRS